MTGGFLLCITIFTSTVHGEKIYNLQFGLDEDKTFEAISGEKFLMNFMISDDQFPNDKHTNFRIVSKLPKWLSYNQTAQLLEGTPDVGDAGEYNVTLSLTANTTLSCNTFDSQIYISIRKAHTISQEKASCKSPPQKLKPFHYLEAHQGQMFEYQIEPDTFVDIQDGNTKDLKLSLTTMFGEPFPRRFWLQLDEVSQVLYGLPYTEDDIETMVVRLVAADSCGLLVKDAISVDIKRTTSPVLYSFVLHFDEYFQQSLGNGKFLYKIVDKLLPWFGDNDKSHIVILDVNSVNLTLSWTFSDAFHDECNNEIISSNLERMVDNSSRVDSGFVCHMLPLVTVMAVDVQFSDVCKLATKGSENTLSYDTHGSDISYWFEVVVPALVFIVLLIVVLAILYWLCYKSSRRGRFLLRSEKPTYLEERQPVIFHTESSAEEAMLQPKSPIVIGPADDDDQLASRIEEQERTMPASPEYTAPAMFLPPPYRLPPPYKSDHQLW